MFSLLMGITSDLGFELLVAVCATLLLRCATRLMTLTGRAVVICMGQARDRGQRDADASKKARSVLTQLYLSFRTLLTFETQLMNVQS